MTTTPPAPAQRLARSNSPYLRQHAANPVDWYEWGEEALARARREDRPVFLSVGYSACHWCHVMAHESFADPAIAALMNELFVNIKVDREERPDLDEIYMQATMVLNQGHGGWPMSVWLTPDLKPFYAGTYFPPRAHRGRPGFAEVCAAIGRAWREHRAAIITQADKLTEVVRDGLRTHPAGETLTLADVDAAAATIARSFDPVSGGMVSGSANKFPQSMALDLLLHVAARLPADDPARRQYTDLVELTLDHMAAGGIYDQLGGGFHRYSTDVEWHVPHFEKMLYDQALIARIYLDAYQVLGKRRYARVVRETCDYVLQDLQSPSGGFHSARDADSDGVEGRYYVWTRDEVFALLGPAEGELFCAHYDVRASGNWRDPHDPGTVKNVLRELRDYTCCGKLYGITPEVCCERLRRSRATLLAHRAKRVPPGLDDKIICEWNGLLIGSLARAGGTLDEPRYVEAATRAASFLLENQCEGGRLRRSSYDGRVSGAAFLSDYACLIHGLIELYEATFDWRWLQEAKALNDTLIAHYWDEGSGGFYFTSDDHETLIARSMDIRGGAVPSGNAIQLDNLLRLNIMLGDARLGRMAGRLIATFADDARRFPWASERFLVAVDFALAGPIEVAVVGDRADQVTMSLIREARATYLPNRVVMLSNPGERDDPAHDTPMLRTLERAEGRPAAYVCRDSTCEPPVTTPQALREVLVRGPR